MTYLFSIAIRLLCVSLRFRKVNEFDESHLCTVTATGTQLIDLGVTAVYCCILRSDYAEQLGNSVLLSDVSKGGATACKRVQIGRAHV